MQVAANYYICLDGGGSKIECVVLDETGKRIRLIQDVVVGAARVEGANVNYDGGAKKLTDQLHVLFTQVKIASTGVALSELLPKVKVIAGMAGAARPDPREKVAQIFEQMGVQRENLTLQGDAEMWLTGIKNKNALVAICGTGHVIFGKVNGEIKDADNNFFRLGGWGPEDRKEVASGYNIALEGLAAVRGMKYEKAEKTALADLLPNYFGDTPILEIPKKFQVAEIAKFAKGVFDAVHIYGDFVAREIIFRCFTDEVATKVQTFLKRNFSETSPDRLEIKYVGGLMKGCFYETLERQVTSKLAALKSTCEVTQENASSKNVAEEYTKTHIFCRIPYV